MKEQKMTSERSAFEQWVVTRKFVSGQGKDYVESCLHRDLAGEYTQGWVHGAWVGWQARTSVPVTMPPEISRDLLGKIVDEVFDGAIEDASVIEDVYRVIAREYRTAPAVVNQQVTTAATCNHEWTDDGQHLLVCTACGAQEDHDPRWRDMATAPRDGTMVRLLVEFTEHATEDADQAPTIGANNFENDGEDRWQFAGWCWSHDHFTQGKGEPIGWLPMLDEPRRIAASNDNAPWSPSGIDYDRSIHSNPDAKAWADMFVTTFPGLADKHELMIGWFANAMMAMHDFLKAQLSGAASDVLAERQRQINAEGWAPDHDDEHDGGELAAAGAAYALHAADYLNPHSQGDGGDEAPDCWPWHDAIAGRGEGQEKTKPAWWKPGAPRRNLIKAGALILAEIERLDRAEQAKQQEQQP